MERKTRFLLRDGFHADPALTLVQHNRRRNDERLNNDGDDDNSAWISIDRKYLSIEPILKDKSSLTTAMTTQSERANDLRRTHTHTHTEARTRMQIRRLIIPTVDRSV